MAALTIARALFRAALPQFVSMGFSARRMVKELHSMGVAAPRWSNMLADIREYRGFVKKEGVVRSLARNVLPKPGHMVETALRQSYKYRVFANVNVLNKVTGESSTRLISFYDDENRTLEEWEEEYERQVEEASYREDEEIESLDFRSIEHNKGWAY